MEGNPKLGEKKKKRKLSLEDIYRLLERVYTKLSGSRRSILDKILSKHNRGGGVRLKPNPSPYQKQQRYVKQLPEPKYNPKPEKPSFSGGKIWSEPKANYPKERLVYDPEVKAILQRIEKNLRETVNSEPKENQEEPSPYEFEPEKSAEDLEASLSEESEEVLEKAGDDDLVETTEQETEKQEDEPTKDPYYDWYLEMEADTLREMLSDADDESRAIELDQIEAEPVQEEIPDMDLELPEFFEEELEEIEEVEPEEH